MTPTSRDEVSLRAVTVASWFPAMDDTTRGRFVADQVEALRATGAVDEVVVSFEPAQLVGDAFDRHRQAAAVHRVAHEAVRDEPAVFAANAQPGPAGIPIARLPIPNGNRAFGTATHAAEDRRDAMRSVAGRLASPLPTVVHAHTGYPDGSAAVALMSPLAAPLLITEHAHFVGQQLAHPEIRRIYGDAVRVASRLIAVSQGLADELRSEFPDYGHKVVVIPNTVQMDEFRPTPPDLRRPDELLYVGYRTEIKGLDILLAAFAQVRAARPAATLRLVGRSPTPEIEDGWRRLAGELGVADAVIFEGPRLRRGVAEAMAEAAVLVHASRTETFGIAPVEALAAGLPVVAAASSGLREILGPDPGALGALVPVGDPSALAAAVLATLDRRATFDATRLRAAVEERFGGAAVARRIVDLYREVRAEHRVHRAARRTTPRGDLVRAVPADHWHVLVVAFDTASAAGLLSAIPAEQRGTVALVCSAGPGVDDLPKGLARVFPVDTSSLERWLPPHQRSTGPRGNFLARLLRVLRDPLAALRRRRFAVRRDALHATAVDGALAALVLEAGWPQVPGIAPVDGVDYIAADRMVTAGRARGLPGGVRWLADQLEIRSARSAQVPASASETQVVRPSALEPTTRPA